MSEDTQEQAPHDARATMERAADRVAGMASGHYRHAIPDVQYREFLDALLTFASSVREDALGAAGRKLREIADHVRREAVEAIHAADAQARAKVVGIAVDPGMDGTPSALYVLTADGTVWSRMEHVHPSPWTRVALPPGCAAPPSSHERHLALFREKMAALVDPKLVQDAYDAAEEQAAMTTTEETPQ